MHINSIDFLRAIGAVAVCIFHFTLAYLNKENPFYTIFQHGHLGVEIFFVISAFLIPSSLLRKNYQINQWAGYIKDRLIRIHPAYLGAVMLFFLQEVVCHFLPPPLHKPFSINTLDLIGHFTYLQPYIGRAWFVILFWTLAVQFQFYMFYGVSHFLFIHEKKWIRYIILIGMMAMPFLIGKGTVDYGFGAVDLNNFLPHYFHIFVVGILLFMLQKNYLNQTEYWAFLLVDCYLLYLYRGEMLRPSAVLFTSVCINYIAIEHQIFKFLGKISYSLYLIHLATGWHILAVCKYFLHIENEFALTLSVLAATGFSIFCAYFFNKYFEEPSIEWAKKKFDKE